MDDVFFYVFLLKKTVFYFKKTFFFPLHHYYYIYIYIDTVYERDFLRDTCHDLRSLRTSFPDKTLTKDYISFNVIENQIFFKFKELIKH